MNVAPALGLLGRAPGLAPGALIRVSRLQDFERHVGALADRPSLIAHAAAHAFMGGVDRVLVSGPVGEAPAAWARALTTLIDAGATAVLAPGAVPPLVAHALVEALDAQAAAPGPTPTLWLDAPAAAPREVMAARADLAPPRARIWLVAPAVRALTPGRPRPERMGGCAVVGALVMGAAHELGPLVEVDHRYSPEDLGHLQAGGGVAALVARGPRRLVRLAWPPPPVRVDDQPLVDPSLDRPDDEGDAPHDALEARILRAVADATEPIVADGPRGASLWPALERAARIALDALVASGTISAYVVRAADGELEVGYRTPKRVREVKVSVARLDPGD